MYHRGVPRSAADVLLRARATLALASRGFIEAGTYDDAAGALGSLRDDVAVRGIRDALTADELTLFDTPHGALERTAITSLTWHLEHAAVLAWALSLIPRPAHDEPADSTLVADALTSAASPAVRTPAIVADYASDLRAFSLRHQATAALDVDAHHMIARTITERLAALAWLLTR